MVVPSYANGHMDIIQKCPGILRLSFFLQLSSLENNIPRTFYWKLSSTFTGGRLNHLGINSTCKKDEWRNKVWVKETKTHSSYNLDLKMICVKTHMTLFTSSHWKKNCQHIQKCSLRCNHFYKSCYTVVVSIINIK